MAEEDGVCIDADGDDDGNTCDDNGVVGDDDDDVDDEYWGNEQNEGVNGGNWTHKQEIVRLEEDNDLWHNGEIKCWVTVDNPAFNKDIGGTLNSCKRNDKS